MPIIQSLLPYNWPLSIVRKSHTMMPVGIITNPCYLTSAGLSRLLGSHLSQVDSNFLQFLLYIFPAFFHCFKVPNSACMYLLHSQGMGVLPPTWENENHVRIASLSLSSATTCNIPPSLLLSSSLRVFFSLPRGNPIHFYNIISHRSHFCIFANVVIWRPGALN